MMMARTLWCCVALVLFIYTSPTAASIQFDRSADPGSPSSNCVGPFTSASGICGGTGTTFSHGGWKGVTAGCHITMAGRPSRASAIAAHPEQCTDNDTTAAVRCCDDSGGGFSPDCQTLDYEGAAAHCASTQGHRLCTKGELDQTKGSGCGFDNVRAWTSSTQEARFL